MRYYKDTQGNGYREAQAEKPVSTGKVSLPRLNRAELENIEALVTELLKDFEADEGLPGPYERGKSRTWACRIQDNQGLWPLRLPA